VYFDYALQPLTLQPPIFGGQQYRCLIVGLGASHTLESGAFAKNEENFRFTERSMHGSDIKNRENHGHEQKKFMPPAEAVSSIR